MCSRLDNDRFDLYNMHSLQINEEGVYHYAKLNKQKPNPDYVFIKLIISNSIKKLRFELLYTKMT